jgi:hypothetical protein
MVWSSLGTNEWSGQRLYVRGWHVSCPHHEGKLDVQVRDYPGSCPISGLTVGSSTWCLSKLPEDVLKFKVKATALLQSRLVGPIPGVLLTFLSCHSFCFSAGVNQSNLASE